MGKENPKRKRSDTSRSNKKSKKESRLLENGTSREDSHQQPLPEEGNQFNDITARPSRNNATTNTRSVTTATIPSSSSGRRNGSKKKVAFLKKKIDFVVSLLPGALRNCDDAVERSIDQLLLKHSPGIGGIMMAYENLNFNKQHQKDQGRGWILNELPYVHFNVTCDILVFRPVIGCELRGVANECFPSHISILVFQYFNAMVSAEELRAAGYIYDRDVHKWIHRNGSGNDDNATVRTEIQIRFVVSKIHECEGTISLEGSKPSLSMSLENE